MRKRILPLAVPILVMAVACNLGPSATEPASSTPTTYVVSPVLPTDARDVTTPSSAADADGGSGAEVVLVAPYVNEADMAGVNEAFSLSSDSPWGFEHRGIDFSPTGNLRPFRAICFGVVDTVALMQLESTSNWQVSVRVVCNPTYSAIYAFEPMTALESDGQTQLASISVAEQQAVGQGDVIGHLLFRNAASHVHLGFYENGDAVCPEPFLTQEAGDSILRLIRVVWPSAGMCY